MKMIKDVKIVKILQQLHVNKLILYLHVQLSLDMINIVFGLKKVA
jgi:hypothetical protein